VGTGLATIITHHEEAKMLFSDLKSLLRKVLEAGVTIFKLRPDLFVKGLIYVAHVIRDLFRD